MNQDFSFSDESLAQYKSFLEKGESVIDSSWEKFFEGANFKVWRALKEGTETYKYRSIGRIDCPAEQYFAFYRDLDYWKTWDNNVAGKFNIERQILTIQLWKYLRNQIQIQKLFTGQSRIHSPWLTETMFTKDFPG
eukprot:TRINITY_DN31_c0_g2_i5.p1 TRINITY_DN31_c0_g2~~TRINITY_DN31_c0_g2_i5.p1  ORF type:complete len:136 (-),score=9.22 TRINITY_DN31_c0_g2_i5:522-929(-)